VKVFVTRLLPRSLLQPLVDAGATIDMFEEDRRCPRDELLARSRGADAMLVQTLDVIDSPVIDGAPELRVVATCSVGFDNIDVDAAAARGIAVCNAPAPDLIETTAEAAVALLLDVAKRITQLHNAARQGSLPHYSVMQPMGQPVRDRVSGIVGAGRIGGAIARIMQRGFGNSILYFGRSEKPELEKSLGARRCGLAELMGESDFVFVVVPLTPATRNLLDAQQLGHLKQDAIVVNVGRAGIIDDVALNGLLAERGIFGAGLDVYDADAFADGYPNLVLTAHMANGEDRAMQATIELAVSNVAAVLEGKPPVTPVTRVRA
jgi:glyoxylate reductase